MKPMRDSVFISFVSHQSRMAYAERSVFQSVVRFLAADEVRRIVEELCEGSTAYKAAVKARDEAWAVCERKGYNTVQASNAPHKPCGTDDSQMK